MTDYDLYILSKSVKDATDKMTAAEGLRDLCSSYDRLMQASKQMFEYLISKFEDDGK